MGSETDEGGSTERRGRRSSSQRPLHSSSATGTSEETKQQRKKSRTKKPNVQRSKSGSGLDLYKKASSLDADSGDGGSREGRVRRSSSHRPLRTSSATSTSEKTKQRRKKR